MVVDGFDIRVPIQWKNTYREEQYKVLREEDGGGEIEEVGIAIAVVDMSGRTVILGVSGAVKLKLSALGGMADSRGYTRMRSIGSLDEDGRASMKRTFIIDVGRIDVSS